MMANTDEALTTYQDLAQHPHALTALRGAIAEPVFHVRHT